MNKKKRGTEESTNALLKRATLNLQFNLDFNLQFSELYILFDSKELQAASKKLLNFLKEDEKVFLKK